MTLKEFKNRLTELGIKDEDIINFQSVDDISEKIEDFNSETVQMVAQSNDENPVGCWEIYI